MDQRATRGVLRAYAPLVESIRPCGAARFSPPPELRASDPADFRFDRRNTNYRLLVDPGPIEIDDKFAGASTHRPANEVGDFVIWTKRNAPAYQLAVVVDDGVVTGPRVELQCVLMRLEFHKPVALLISIKPSRENQILIAIAVKVGKRRSE